MSIVIYSLGQYLEPSAIMLDDHQLIEALQHAERLRKMGHRHVSISTEFSDSSTKAGVGEIDFEYDWKKRRV